MTRPVTALLITGTVGSGKTSVAEAVGDLLTEREIPNAVIDADWLRRCWPAPSGDRFHHALTLRNLRAVSRNFLDLGVQRLVVAGVVESRAERDDYAAALGVPVTVCRLRVAPAELSRRLRRRHETDPAGLEWHLARAPELDRILDEAGVENLTVDVGTLPVAEVAQAVLAPRS